MLSTREDISHLSPSARFPCARNLCSAAAPSYPRSRYARYQQPPAIALPVSEQMSPCRAARRRDELDSCSAGCPCSCLHRYSRSLQADQGMYQVHAAWKPDTLGAISMMCVQKLTPVQEVGTQSSALAESAMGARPLPVHAPGPGRERAA